MKEKKMIYILKNSQKKTDKILDCFMAMGGIHKSFKQPYFGS